MEDTVNFNLIKYTKEIIVESQKKVFKSQYTIDYSGNVVVKQIEKPFKGLPKTISISDGFIDTDIASLFVIKVVKAINNYKTKISELGSEENDNSCEILEMNITNSPRPIIVDVKALRVLSQSDLIGDLLKNIK